MNATEFQEKRKELCMTIREMAQALDVTEQTVVRWGARGVPGHRVNSVKKLRVKK